MSTSVMEPYQPLPRDFPLILYRIHYPESQTRYSQRRGFTAASNFTPYAINGFRNAVTNHLDWGCKVRSPFISTFRNREHAENWARRRLIKNDSDSCEIMKIKVDLDDDVMVFRLAYLVDRLAITTALDRSKIWSEYIFFHRIPSEVILEVDSISYSGYSESDFEEYD
ncbi:hypothetical protein FRC18_008541 [Serendipita sp. 400]|nr:hypothetical protein FRC18_008541 [Serendipita sp. 400]